MASPLLVVEPRLALRRDARPVERLRKASELEVPVHRAHVVPFVLVIVVELDVLRQVDVHLEGARSDARVPRNELGAILLRIQHPLVAGVEPPCGGEERIAEQKWMAVVGGGEVLGCAGSIANDTLDYLQCSPNLMSGSLSWYLHCVVRVRVGRVRGAYQL